MPDGGDFEGEADEMQRLQLAVLRRGIAHGQERAHCSHSASASSRWNSGAEGASTHRLCLCEQEERPTGPGLLDLARNAPRHRLRTVGAGALLHPIHPINRQLRRERARAARGDRLLSAIEVVRSWLQSENRALKLELEALRSCVRRAAASECGAGTTPAEAALSPLLHRYGIVAAFRPPSPAAVHVDAMRHLSLDGGAPARRP